MTLDSIHPGITPNQIIENAEFRLNIPNDLPQTVSPTREQLDLLRHEIDPLGVGEIELLESRRRLDRIQQILEEQHKIHVRV
ncbi:MAG: hypothetical protein PVG99_08710 [Desulfobacteraceae bacterium]|jgi:glutaconate CoA-transferase subunit B